MRRRRRRRRKEGRKRNKEEAESDSTCTPLHWLFPRGDEKNREKRKKLRKRRGVKKRKILISGGQRIKFRKQDDITLNSIRALFRI